MSNRRRVVLTGLEKKQICMIVKNSRELKQAELLSVVEETLGKTIDRTTLSKIIKNSESWLSLDAKEVRISRKRQRNPKWKGLEEELFLWFNQERSQNAYIGERLLKEKAQKIAQQLELTDFSGSQGWLQRFKQRYDIRSSRRHGEAGAGEGVNLGKKAAPKITGQDQLAFQNIMDKLNQLNLASVACSQKVLTDYFRSFELPTTEV